MNGTWNPSKITPVDGKEKGSNISISISISCSRSFVLDWYKFTVKFVKEKHWHGFSHVNWHQINLTSFEELHLGRRFQGVEQHEQQRRSSKYNNHRYWSCTKKHSKLTFGHSFVDWNCDGIHQRSATLVLKDKVSTRSEHIICNDPTFVCSRSTGWSYYADSHTAEYSGLEGVQW